MQYITKLQHRARYLGYPNAVLPKHFDDSVGLTGITDPVEYDRISAAADPTIFEQMEFDFKWDLNLTGNILKAKFLVETLSPITDPNFINNINFIDSVIKEIDEIELFTSKLDTANDNVVTAELVLAEIETELSSKQIELDNLIKEIKDNNIACDTCNTVGGVKI